MEIKTKLFVVALCAMFTFSQGLASLEDIVDEQTITNVDKKKKIKVGSNG